MCFYNYINRADSPILYFTISIAIIIVSTTVLYYYSICLFVYPTRLILSWGSPLSLSLLQLLLYLALPRSILYTYWNVVLLLKLKKNILKSLLSWVKLTKEMSSSLKTLKKPSTKLKLFRKVEAYDQLSRGPWRKWYDGCLVWLLLRLWILI
jgi:hypothetical protein